MFISGFMLIGIVLLLAIVVGIYFTFRDK